jgi:hypothetical protein
MSKKRTSSDVVHASPMTRMAQDFGETLPEEGHSQGSVRTSQVYCTPEYLSLDFCTPTDEQGLKSWSQEAAQVSTMNFFLNLISFHRRSNGPLRCFPAIHGFWVSTDPGQRQAQKDQIAMLKSPKQIRGFPLPSARRGFPTVVHGRQPRLPHPGCNSQRHSRSSGNISASSVSASSSTCSAVKAGQQTNDPHRGLARRHRPRLPRARAGALPGTRRR